MAFADAEDQSLRQRLAYALHHCVNARGMDAPFTGGLLSRAQRACVPRACLWGCKLVQSFW